MHSCKRPRPTHPHVLQDDAGDPGHLVGRGLHAKAQEWGVGVVGMLTLPRSTCLAGMPSARSAHPDPQATHQVYDLTLQAGRGGCRAGPTTTITKPSSPGS